jgi:hypothetical protein
MESVRGGDSLLSGRSWDAAEGAAARAASTGSRSPGPADSPGEFRGGGSGQKPGKENGGGCDDGVQAWLSRPWFKSGICSRCARAHAPGLRFSLLRRSESGLGSWGRAPSGPQEVRACPAARWAPLMAAPLIPVVPRATAAEQAVLGGSGDRGAARAGERGDFGPGTDPREREGVRDPDRQGPGSCRKVGAGGPVAGLVLDADEVIVGVALGFGMTLRLDPRPVIVRPDIQNGYSAGKDRKDGHDEEGNGPQGKGDTLLHPPFIPFNVRPASTMEILA